MYNQVNQRGYYAAQAFSAAYANNAVGQMANYNRVYLTPNFANPGRPVDSFRRSYNFTSQRQFTPVEKENFLKDVGNMLTSIGWIANIVSFFYPPAAIVSTATSLAAPAMTTMAGDTTPKPVVYRTNGRYNPWLR